MGSKINEKLSITPLTNWFPIIKNITKPNKEAGSWKATLKLAKYDRAKGKKPFHILVL
jgi:hypothetical protein